MRNAIRFVFVWPHRPGVKEHPQLGAKAVFQSAAGLAKPILAAIELMTAVRMKVASENLLFRQTRCLAH